MVLVYNIISYIFIIVMWQTHNLNKTKKGVVNMKKVLFFVTALTVAISSIAPLASAAPITYSFADGNYDSSQLGTYGVPKEDNVDVNLDIKSKWSSALNYSDHSSERSALRATVSKSDSTKDFDAIAYLDMTGVAAEWDAYLGAAAEYAIKKGIATNEEEARNYAKKLVTLEGEYSIEITCQGTGSSAGSDLVGIENTKLQNQDTSGFEWVETTVDDYTFGAESFFEFASQSYQEDAANGERKYTLVMKVKDDVNEALDEYFTKINSADDDDTSYDFLTLSIPANTVGKAGTIYPIEGTFSGYVNIKIGGEKYKVTFGSTGDDGVFTPQVTDNEYVTLSVSGGGGSPSSPTTPTEQPTVTEAPTATDEPSQTGEPSATDVPGTSETHTPAPVETPGTETGAHLNYDDHYAYIIGYPVEDGQTQDYREVRPQNNITRAEVATIFFRMLTDESRAEFWTKENPYSDVNINDWFNNAISTATNAGIVNGYDTGDFKPNAPITRAEFAAIAARFSSREYSGADMFSDISGHWAREDINRAADIGWITGYEDGTFRPDQYITRAEAMTLINRLLYRLVDNDGLHEDMVRWIDNNPGAWYYANVQEATNSHYYDRVAIGYYETWTSIREPRDWEALEKALSEVTDAGSEESVFDESLLDEDAPIVTEEPDADEAEATEEPDTTEEPSTTEEPDTTEAPEA